MIGAKFLLISIAAVCCAITGLASSGIEGSKHDFSGQAGSDVDKCTACHIPKKDDAPKAAPLWNQRADLKRRFNGQDKRVSRPGDGTRICLQCHDGTIAKPVAGGVKTERFVYTKHPRLFTAGHGRSDHPVGIIYPTFSDDFHPIATVLSKGTVLLPHGRVECTSCHNPHNQTDAPFMLVRSNARSALCLTCHKK